MATTQPSIVAETVRVPPHRTFAPTSFWARALTPSFSDCFFIFLFVWLFLAGPQGWNALLADADIGWHIRTGQWILANHAVPTHDLFSFSKAGAPWFAWEWLSDVIFASLFGAAGMKGVLLVTGIVLASYSTIVVRHAFWRGANAMVALPLALLGVGSSTVHFLARPHIFTLLLLASSLWLVELDRRRPTRWIWVLIPLTVVWINLHGGFFMFMACLAVIAIGAAVEAMLGSGSVREARWATVRRYIILLAGCGAASLVNPYGINLHKHIAEYLSSDWIRNNIQEFMAPTFRTEGQRQFEIVLIIGLLVVAPLLRKRRIADALLILFLAHSSLMSVRHATIFCLACVPLIAEEISCQWSALSTRMPRKSILATLHSMGSDLAKPFRRSTAWIPVTLLIVALAPLSWPTDFPKVVFPTDLVNQHAGLLQSSRVLTTDQWADYLIFRFYPRQKVYVDGRSDFYGEQLGNEYLHLLQLAPGWEQTLARRGFDAVLLPPHWPLVQMLKSSPQWRVEADTTTAVLFLRRADSSSVAGVNASPTGSFVLKNTRTEPNENLQQRRSL